ncbi:hypothetical protein [Microbulbifer sediminum]|uniref:hypothetical protein n=1 Tax=Microbulbifer sediminum TaxID=2904250 RepID=UPI001F43AE9E|nr:hypothetical protein [Microbulbifer sediminum]
MKQKLVSACVAALILQSALVLAEQPQVGAEEAKQQAITVAADYLDVRADRLAVIAIEPRTWSDSSLGCPKPGRRYLPATIEGYIATVAHGSEHYRVHLGDNRGLVCEGVLREGA